MAYQSIAVWLNPTSHVGVADRPHPSLPVRVATIAWDSLTIHVGQDTDEETAASAGLLAAAAAQLRDAAIARIAARDARLSSEDAEDAELGDDGLPDVPLADLEGHEFLREGQPEFNGAFR